MSCTRLDQWVIGINVVSILMNIYGLRRLHKVREFYVQMIADIRRHYEGE